MLRIENFAMHGVRTMFTATMNDSQMKKVNDKINSLL